MIFHSSGVKSPRAGPAISLTVLLCLPRTGEGWGWGWGGGGYKLGVNLPEAGHGLNHYSQMGSAN